MYTYYPLWKNVLLVLVAVFALIYALPNLYREQPVVQVSVGKTGQLATLQTQTQDLLQKAQVPYEAMRTSAQGVEFVFHSTDAQLHAFDVLQQALQQTYTIALNLAPATPRWMQWIHAEPMKQGLDLRGGIHFLLEVDMDSVMTKRYEGLMKSMGQTLRSARIRYALIRVLPQGKGVKVSFRSEVTYQMAALALKEQFPELDIGLQPEANAITLQLSVVALNRVRQETIDQTMNILRNRVNELGVGEAIVQQQGATRIAVDLPGIQDAVRAKQILGGTATLEFHMLDNDNDPVKAMQSGIVPINSKLYQMDGRPLLLNRQVVLSGEAITSAVSSFDQQSATPSVQIQLGSGEHLFTQVTRDNIGRRMAIVFVETKTQEQTVNGEKKYTTHREERVISAPVIQSALGSQFQITGLTDSAEASNLALLLRAGALPAAIYPIEELTVGPSLGQENINRGLISLEVGMGLIIIVMLVYYRLFGMIANIALFLNLIFLSAMMSLLGATLTLPGIAGFVLTVGMAVDANVLINERIREELRAGLSPHAAIQAGYDRAFSTIIDSNLTTLIVGMVLFAVGSGPVRGFAIILCLGLLTSMLTSITYTRAIVNWIYGYRSVKYLSIGLKGQSHGII